MAAKRMKAQSDVPVLTLVGFDPGMVNHGFSVIETRRLPKQHRQFRVIRAGKIANCLAHYDAWSDELLAFKAEIEAILDQHNPDLVCIERFILRRRIPKGVTVEVVNAMIGIIGLLASERGIPLVPLSAVVWKNATKRAGYDLDRMYKDSVVEAHLIDATLIAIYGVCWYFGADDESYFESNLEAVIQRVEIAAECGLINRRHRK